MEKLFGIPMNGLMMGLLVIFALCAVILTISALRNKVMFRIAARNIPRRPAQTSLIVLGLMLAAMLFSASFTTGDTLSHSIRTIAVEYLGEVDILVDSELEDASGRPSYFDEAEVARVRDTLADLSEDGTVEGIAPAISEQVPVVAPESQLNEPAVDLLGLDAEWVGSFDPLIDEQGNELSSLDSLDDGEVYVSTGLAEELEVNIGNMIEVHLGPEATPLTIGGIYEKGGNPTGDLSMVMSLPQLQSLMVEAGNIDAAEINVILITNQGDTIGGAAHTNAVMATLEPSLDGTGLEAEPIKQDVLEEADEVGSMFSTIFLVLGQFSIAAGILLIFLIFVMLAAERKRELGIARAVGTQRRQIIRMFTFEGVLYGLIAAAIGSVLGIVIGWAMVQIMALALGQMDFELVYDFNPRSLVIAYTMGVLLTLVVVALSAWWVSRLNIVRAIRDIPEPKRLGGWLGTVRLVIGIVSSVWGILFLSIGMAMDQAGGYLLGGSVIIIGLSLLARQLRVPERVAYTTAGVGLLLWWLLPLEVHPLAEEMNQGMELFFLSGIMTVTGIVLVVMYNSDLLLAAITNLFGHLRWLAPVLKTAVSYPMASQFRTGITLAMFSLVVFTLVVMSVINTSFTALYNDTDRVSGGFDIRGTTSYINPLGDINTALEEDDGVDPNDFESIASLTHGPAEIRQADTDQEWAEDFYIEGVDANYTENAQYEFTLMAEGYNSPDQVWQALTDEEGLAVVASWLVPSRVNYNLGGDMPSFQFEGFYREDFDVLPEIYIESRHPVTGQEQTLHVIGVLEGTAIYGAPVTTSQDTLSALMPTPVPPTTYMFQANPDVEDVPALAKDLEAQFLENGMDTTVIAEEVEDFSKVNAMFNDLIQGFMGLGLIVGIAALGVIAARSVVERRQQIGMLRAIGFQRGMVQFSFLLESSFIALLGIGLGVALGCAIAAQVISDASADLEGVQIQIPWVRIAVIVAIAYLASLITTYMPARQAARVYPAEALRCE
jgi:putative ABC transport system permease protein